MEETQKQGKMTAVGTFKDYKHPLNAAYMQCVPHNQNYIKESLKHLKKWINKRGACFTLTLESLNLFLPSKLTEIFS